MWYWYIFFSLPWFTEMLNQNLLLKQLLRSVVAHMNHETDDSITFSSVPLFGVLGKLCWSIVQFLEDDIMNANLAIHDRVAEYAKCLLLVFCPLRYSQEELFGT